MHNMQSTLHRHIVSICLCECENICTQYLTKSIWYETVFIIYKINSEGEFAIVSERNILSNYILALPLKMSSTELYNYYR